jgi:hypothetical protein
MNSGKGPLRTYGGLSFACGLGRCVADSSAGSGSFAGVKISKSVYVIFKCFRRSGYPNSKEIF